MYILKILINPDGPNSSCSSSRPQCMCHQGPRINWQSVWHKLNAGSLEDQRTSLMSDADDFLNPFSSVCVCVCFLFLFWEVKWVHPKSSSLNFLKELEYCGNNSTTTMLPNPWRFKITLNFYIQFKLKWGKKGFRTLLFFAG